MAEPFAGGELDGPMADLIEQYAGGDLSSLLGGLTGGGQEKEPVEWVTGADGNQTLVYYSLGNFISAQTEEACRLGGLAYFAVTKENGVCRITEHGLKTLVTEENNGHYTTRLLEQEG